MSFQFQLLNRVKHASLCREEAYVDGKWIKSKSDRYAEVTDPATGGIIGTVPLLNEQETELAISAAEAALPGWRTKTAKERSRLLKNWHHLMMQHQEDLAIIMTLEQGKPLVESRGEIAYAASFIEWFAEEAKRTYGDITPSHLPGSHILTLKEPVGICAAITPWNFPSAMITRKAAPALAAGCTIIVKPALETPFSALALAALAEEAGIPQGVFQVVTCESRVIGPVLTQSPRVRKLSFTGSTAVGRTLMEQCSGTLKRLSLELGGNAPFIVFESADIARTAKGALASKYRNSGQTCVCVNRFYVQRSVYEPFLRALLAEVKQLKVGNGMDAGVTQGPLINPVALEKVETLLADALAKGARLLTGGKRHPLGGLFFEPTIVYNTTRDMAITSEEIFGPIAAVSIFDTEEEAIALANASEYGLASYVYSNDLGQVWRVAEQLEYGMVGVNEGIISTELAPFGGIKQSGFGREGSYQGLEEYLNTKYVLMGGLKKG